MDEGKEEGRKEVKEVQSCVLWVKCSFTPSKPNKDTFSLITSDL